MSLKENLKAAMEDQKISITQLSKRAGVPVTTIHGLLNTSNQKRLDVVQLQKICNVLSVPLYEMIFSKPDPNAKTEIGAETLTDLFRGDIRVVVQRINREK